MAESKQGRKISDPIADLVRDAGPRPPRPEVDLETLGGPALAAWQQQQRERRKQRLTLLTAAALVPLAVALFFLFRYWSQPQVGVVIALAGQASPEIEVGMEIYQGLWVSTSKQPAQWLTVELEGGHRLRLDAGTEIRFTSASRVDLEKGAVYVEAAAAELRIHAGNLEVEHLGTAYEIRLEPSQAEVRVREGRVRVQRGDAVAEIGSGELVRVGRAAAESGSSEAPADPGSTAATSPGRIHVESSPTHGESWSWILQAAPPFESDGAELEAFLTWIEAETGYQVEVDPSLLHHADGEPVRVRGSVRGMSVERALSFVLESAGLSSSFSDGRLRVTDGHATPTPPPAPPGTP